MGLRITSNSRSLVIDVEGPNAWCAAGGVSNRHTSAYVRYTDTGIWAEELQLGKFLNPPISLQGTDSYSGNKALVTHNTIVIDTFDTSIPNRHEAIIYPMNAGYYLLHIGTSPYHSSNASLYLTDVGASQLYYSASAITLNHSYVEINELSVPVALTLFGIEFSKSDIQKLKSVAQSK